MNEYESRQEARRERYEDKAAKATAERDRRYNSVIQRARTMQGEPVKIGHHSEKRHRADIKRMDNDRRKCVEEGEKAKHYTAKAASVGTGGISSDDPEAVVKLKAKLADKEAWQETMKRINREYKKGGWDNVTGLKPATIANCKRAMSYAPKGEKPFPSYATTNNNANIKRIKARIADLEREVVTREPITGDGFTVTEDVDDNRIWFDFDQRPPKSVCQLMRKGGWKWSPSRGVWVRNLNDAGRHSVGYIIERLKACESFSPNAETATS